MRSLQGQMGKHIHGRMGFLANMVKMWEMPTSNGNPRILHWVTNSQLAAWIYLGNILWGYPNCLTNTGLKMLFQLRLTNCSTLRYLPASLNLNYLIYLTPKIPGGLYLGTRSLIVFIMTWRTFGCLDNHLRVTSGSIVNIYPGMPEKFDNC